MNLTEQNLNTLISMSKEFLFWYGIIIGVISAGCAICNLPRFYNEASAKEKQAGCREKKGWDWERIGYAIRFSLYDGIVILFGFIIMLIEILLLLYLIISTDDVTGKIIVGILYLTGLPLTLFCISGRGIEVINKAFIDPGVRKVTISWKGITIETGETGKRTPEQ